MTNTTVTSFPIEELARAVAAQIAANGGAQPTVTVRRPVTPAATPVQVLDTTIGGEVIIDIKYNTTTYGLRFNTPTTEFNAWLFRLTLQQPDEPEVDLALFEFTDASNWLVSVNTPYPIKFGESLTIEKVEIKVKDGVVPPIPPKLPRGH